MRDTHKGFQAEGFGTYPKDMKSITSLILNSFLEMLQWDASLRSHKKRRMWHSYQRLA